MGLRGLEPLTSSLSGKRSNRLSYRPGAGTGERPRWGATPETTPGDLRGQNPSAPPGTARGQSSVRVIRMPPTRAEQML